MGKLERILHVDDDEDIRVLTKMILELVGHYQVEQYASGEEALRHAQNLSPQLFLLDYMMPGISGEELWHRLKALPGLEDVPVVFVTAKTDQAFAQGLLQKGALDVILKPFEVNELCPLIENAWAKRKPGN
jgi:CheY-like chemotaxis protein